MRTALPPRSAASSFFSDFTSVSGPLSLGTSASASCQSIATGPSVSTIVGSFGRSRLISCAITLTSLRLLSIPRTAPSVYRKNIASVVNITSRVMTFDFFYGLVPQEGQGSGFVIDKEGHILTNYHVIAEARQVEVTLHNRKKYKATIVGTDKSHDLAIVQIKAPDLQPMTLGDSANLQVGQKVYAIGNPFGLAGTMGRGG